MIKFIFLLGILCWFDCNTSVAQSIEPLRITEKVPDLLFGKYLNNPGKKVKVSDLKGKLIILDFWNIHCSNCIAAMPEMDSLQKEFIDQIQIIFITKNTEAEVNKLFSKIRTKKPDLPFIVNDTIFNSLFPHNGDPLHVWINQQGYVHAITFDYNTNHTTIRKFLNGFDPLLSRRWDFGINLNYPLLSAQNSSLLDLTKSYSVIFKGLNEYYSESSILFQKDSVTNRTIGVQLINSSLLMLYNTAFNNDLYKMEVNYFNLTKNNRIVLDVKDATNFFPPFDNVLLARWINENQYSYEIKVPPEKSDQIFRWMQDDMNRYLPYKAVIEKRKVRCLILRDLSKRKQDSAGTMHPDLSPDILYNKDKTVSIQNMPLSFFVLQLIYANPGLDTPIINESSYTGNIDMILKTRLSDIKLLSLELLRYGFELEEGIREINMLVIREEEDINK